MNRRRAQDAATKKSWIVACVLARVSRSGSRSRCSTGCTSRSRTTSGNTWRSRAAWRAAKGFRYPADEPSPGTAQQFGRAPGYPLFLAALGVTAPYEHAPRRVQIAQACVGALGIWLIAAIAGRAAGPRAAVTAAAIAAVYPPLIWMPSYVLSETLYSTVALAAALALQEVGGWRLEAGKATDAPNLQPPDLQPPSSILGAVLTGTAILIRPAMLFFVPLAALWLLWQRRTSDAILFVLLTVLCVAPWTIRNHRVYGRWIAVASEGGVTFWTGNHPLARGDGDLAANLDIKRAELAFRARAPGPHARAAGAAVLPGRAGVDPQRSRGVAGAPGAQGVLHGGAARPVVCGTLGEISRRVRRLVPADSAHGGDRGRLAVARGLRPGSGQARKTGAPGTGSPAALAHGRRHGRRRAWCSSRRNGSEYP